MADYKPMSAEEKARLKKAFSSAAAKRAKKKLEDIKEMDKPGPKPAIKKKAKTIKAKKRAEGGGHTARMMPKVGN